MNNLLMPIIMLAGSSSIMIFAWYAHLKYKNLPLHYVILGSWLIAFFEYLLQVPANRYGHVYYSAAQLRIIAEFFTISAFIVFSTFYLKESFSLNYVISFSLIFGAVYFAFWGPFK